MLFCDVETEKIGSFCVTGRQKNIAIFSKQNNLPRLLTKGGRSSALLHKMLESLKKGLMLLSHCGEYPCECKNLIFAVNSPEMIRLARRITDTSEALQKWLRMRANLLRILANFLRSYTITQQSICRISCDSFAIE